MSRLKSPKSARRQVKKQIDTKQAAPSDLEKTAEVPAHSAAAGQNVRLPAAWTVFGRAGKLIGRHWKVFGGIVAVYALLNLLLVRGLGLNSDISRLKELLSVQTGGLETGLTLFALLVGSSGSTSGEAANVYQTLLLIIGSLAIIWALREIMNGQQIRVRDAFYRGMYPLVPVILVTLVIGLQLLPLLIGAVVYSIVTLNGTISQPIEQVIASMGLLALACVSLYLITSSVFGFYIATLPDMPPLQALRSARELVRHRRWMLLRKLLFLPLILLLLAAVVLVPMLLWLTPLAPWVFFGLSMVALAVVHAYMYTLYRELLR